MTFDISFRGWHGCARCLTSVPDDDEANMTIMKNSFGTLPAGHGQATSLNSRADADNREKTSNRHFRPGVFDDGKDFEDPTY